LETVDLILREMREHVSNLQGKISVAGETLSKSQNVNDKIATMKEYQDKMATLNSCWRSKNRANLISNLQQENRQILALEEENRQLRYVLKEMEGGLHLIMEDYRQLFSGFMRSDLIFNFARIYYNQVPPVSSIDFSRYVGLARASERCLEIAEQKIADDQQIIAQLRLENKTLRSIDRANLL